VSCASVCEQTHSRQCCNLLISWLWSQPLWLDCLVWRVRALVCDDQSTVRTQLSQLFAPLACCCLLRACALFEGLLEFWFFVFRFGFLCHFAGFHVANREITLSLLLHRCVESIAHFCSEYSRVRPSTAWACRSFHHAPCLLGRSAVRTQSWLLQRLLGLFVARCALVRNSLQTNCLQWVMTR